MVLSADVGLYSAASMDRESRDDNYMNPHISCWPCNMMMGDYDKAVVKYAVATGNMPLHEQREDFEAYQVARVNNNRKKYLSLEKNPKYRKLANWENIKKDLSVKVTGENLAPLMVEIDELTGQRYCNCTRVHCPLRLSFDKIDSELPHIVRNLQPLLACTNLFKSTVPDHDFRILIQVFREHNKALRGTEAEEFLSVAVSWCAIGAEKVILHRPNHHEATISGSSLT